MPSDVADALLDELSESPLPGARYARDVVRSRLPAILARSRWPSDETAVRELAAALAGEVNFRFLPPRLVNDPIWGEIAAAILASLAGATETPGEAE